MWLVLDLKIDFNVRIKELIKQKRFTSKEIAKLIGMTEVGLSISLSDKGNPSLSTLKKIAEVLDVPLTELFEKSNDDVNGFIRIGESIIEVKSIDDLKKIIEEYKEKKVDI